MNSSPGSVAFADLRMRLMQHFLYKICDFEFPLGYIVCRVKLAREKAPIFKQLKWYEGRQEHILDVVLDPLGEWIACACLSGDLYLVPILPLMTVR